MYHIVYIKLRGNSEKKTPIHQAVFTWRLFHCSFVIHYNQVFTPAKLPSMAVLLASLCRDLSELRLMRQCLIIQVGKLTKLAITTNVYI